MRQVLAAAALSTAAIAFPTRAAVVYVDQNALLGGDGTSWAEAFVHVHDAADVADPGDEIWMAAGTYGGFEVPDGVAIYGGFAGWETDRDQRDWVTNETRLQGNGQARVVSISDVTNVILDGVAISGGVADARYGGGWGGACRITSGGPITIRNCTFTDNRAWLGGAIHAGGASEVVIEDCVFVSNTVGGGGGALWCQNNGELSVERCVFRANEADVAGGAAVVLETRTRFRDCLFAGNVATELAGALGMAVVPEGPFPSASLINCVWSRNEAGFHGAALVIEVPTEIIHCTVTQNTGPDPVYFFQDSYPSSMANSIVWGNSESFYASGATHSCMEGTAHPSAGNINANPLLVQPGTDNVRLSFGSPCIDAADNADVPPDVTTDLAGGQRIQGASVDMGAYEGGFEPLPQAAQADALDQGEAAILVPSGGTPLDSAWVLVQNVSGDDNAIFTVAEPEDAHAGAGGYAEASSVLAISTTLTDGTHFTRVLIPFSDGDLGGADPLDMNATYFAPTTGTWALAVSRNTVNSPGHPRAIGDRIVTEGAGTPQATDQLGDYGVHWNVSTSTGIVWANVDHASEIGAGVASCVEDCAQPPDERTGFLDLVAVLRSWGAGDGPFDADGNGAVGAGDIVAVVVAWGLCPQ